MLVIWDFDGTLADTWPWLAREIVAGADRLGYRKLAPSQIEELRRFDTLAVFEHLNIPADRLPMFAADLRRRAEADAAAFRLFPGIPDLLQTLHDRGHSLALVSSNTEATVRTALGDDLAALFAKVACSVDVFGKAAAFIAILRETAMPPSDTVAIGDETRDLQAAEAAGIRGLVVEWGFADPALLRASAPGRSASSVGQLLDLIGEKVESGAARLTPFEALLHQAVTRPDAIAVVADGKDWTFGRLAAESERLARGLRAHGIKPGDRVALHLTNRIELVLAYYACFRLGAVAAPLNVRLTAAELEDLVRRLDPRLFIGEEMLRPAFEPIPDDVLPPASRIVVRDGGENARERPFTALFSSRDVTPMPEPARNAPALILPTSGTTDKPKLAVLTPDSLAMGVAKMSTIDLGKDVTALIATAMVHGAALTFLLAGVFFGGRAVLLQQFDAEEALSLIEEQQVTWVFGLPTTMAGLVECHRTAPRRTGSLRTCLVAGDVSPPELHGAFADVFGLPLRSVLASTEIGWPFRPGGTPVAVGRVPFGMTYRITDADGRSVEAGESGELQVPRRDCLTVGYWQGPGQIDELSAGDWFGTGDLVRLDADGDLWFVGRSKDFIVRGGSNISPAEVEAVLRNHHAVKDVAVAGIPDPELGQRVAAAIVAKDGMNPPPADAIIAFARERLAAYRLPERIAFVQRLPRTAGGKLDRKDLARMLETELASKVSLNSSDITAPDRAGRGESD